MHYEPQSGVWYCEELQIQLSYEDDEVTYITENGKQIIGTCETDRGSKWIGVLCRTDEVGYYVGDQLFLAKIISLNDDTLVLYHEDTNQKYIFLRKD